MFGLPVLAGGLVGGLLNNIVQSQPQPPLTITATTATMAITATMAATATTTSVKPPRTSAWRGKISVTPQQDFARGDFFGGMQELADANQHMADGYSHLSGRS